MIETGELILYFILSVTSLFVIINPFSTVAVFIPLAGGLDKKIKEEMLINSAKMGWAILIIFSISGLMIFQLFGLSIGSFKIAGGILLLIISLKMIFKGTEISESKNGDIHKEFSSKDDLTVIPLTIPFTSGPGAITSVIVLSSQATSTLHWMILFFSITIAILLNYIILSNSKIIEKVLKARGIKVLTKLIGIIVCSVGIQFIVNGLKDLIPFILSGI